MWYPWIALMVTCALGAETTPGPGPTATTARAPPRTLDRQAGELAWRTWLQSAEDGNQNSPPRRITTKSLFITPLVCPKGHRLDGTACVQVVTVSKDEHERILLDQLNALFTASPNNGEMYDYGDEDPGPLQLSIPIGLDPQNPQDPSAQTQDLQPNYVKKGDADASIEAELELLKLQQAHAKLNSTNLQGGNVLSHNVLHNLLSYSDKPKRDSPMTNSSEEAINSADEGQKELVFGHVNVDPVIYDTVNPYSNQDMLSDSEVEKASDEGEEYKKTQIDDQTNTSKVNETVENSSNTSQPVSKKDSDDTKLNPENDYSDIGEAIKLISRYAEVSTDDNFAKDDKTLPPVDDGILGTRTKLQYRRNKPKETDKKEAETQTLDVANQDSDKLYPKDVVYYKYPWPSQKSESPSNYPFRHLQDYWPGRTQFGGVYAHENPRRHHHSYPHYLRPRGFALGYDETHSGLQEAYPGLRRYPHKAEHNASPMRSHANNQDLYSLLGLRHWFSGEGASKR